MKMVGAILWYLGVLLAAVALVLAYLTKSWPLTVFVVVLAVVLKRTNRRVPLPKVYRDMGVRNEYFEGKSRSELKKILEADQKKQAEQDSDTDKS